MTFFEHKLFAEDLEITIRIKKQFCGMEGTLLYCRGKLTTIRHFDLKSPSPSRRGYLTGQLSLPA